MSTYNSPPENSTASQPRISGPHPEFDHRGNPTGYDYYRCEGCGTEAMTRSLTRNACACR